MSGRQDDVKAVAGHALMFFAELRESEELHQGARELARSAIDRAKVLLVNQLQRTKRKRSGCKAHALRGG